MFGWNPFHTPEKPAPTPIETAATLDNTELLETIRVMKLDTLMGDMRPMHRAILGTTLIVPLHERPISTTQGDKIRVMTFRDDTTFFAFTDLKHFDEFAVAHEIQPYPHLVQGKMFCEMAMQMEMSLLAINPGSEEHYAMPPHVFRVLAFGVVPSSVAEEVIHSDTITIARPISGLPSEEELDAWRGVLKNHGANAAYWFNILLEDVGEMRYAIGIDCGSADPQALSSDLIGAWFGIWPVNTPLYLLPLSNDETSNLVRQGSIKFFG